MSNLKASTLSFGRVSHKESLDGSKLNFRDCRSRLRHKAHLGNPYLPLGIGAVIVLQMLFTYAPPLQALFDTEAVPLRIWRWLVLGSVVFFLMVEAEKWIVRTARRR